MQEKSRYDPMLQLSDLSLSRTKPRRIDPHLSPIHLPTTSVPKREITSPLLNLISQDQVTNTHNKIIESQIRDELNQYRLSYEAKKQENDTLEVLEECLRDNQVELRKSIDKAVTDVNTHWEKALQDKQQIIDKLTEQLHKGQLDSLQREKVMEKLHDDRVKALISEWTLKLDLAEEKHKFELDSYSKHLSSQYDAKEASADMRLELKENQIREHYEKRLKKYEKQIMEAEQAYQSKALTVQGSLDEARRENDSLKAFYDAKEEALREEVSLKDKRLIALRGKLDQINQISKALDEWRRIAAEVAAISIRTCAKAEEFPNNPFQKYFQPGHFATSSSSINLDNINDALSQHEAEVKFIQDYRKMKKKSVAVERKLMVNLLRYAKVSFKSYFS